MKFCPKCNTYKKLSKFGQLKSSKDKLSYWCKKCLREKMRSWSSNPKNRKRQNEIAAKYRRTEKGKATKKRYYYSPKGQETYKKYNQKVNNKTKARQAVNHAVESGKLPAAKLRLHCHMDFDSNCEGPMEYHHHNGYKKDYWLDVIPLCRKHHCIIEGINYHSQPS